MELEQLFSILRKCSNDAMQQNIHHNTHQYPSKEHEVTIYRFEQWCFSRKLQFDSMKTDLLFSLNPRLQHQSSILQWFKHQNNLYIYKLLVNIVMRVNPQPQPIHHQPAAPPQAQCALPMQAAPLHFQPLQYAHNVHNKPIHRHSQQPPVPPVQLQPQYQHEYKAQAQEQALLHMAMRDDARDHIHHQHYHSYSSSNDNDTDDQVQVAEVERPDADNEADEDDEDAPQLDLSNSDHFYYEAQMYDTLDHADTSYCFQLSVANQFMLRFSIYDFILSLQSLNLSTSNAVWQRIPKNEDDLIGEKKALCLCMHILICISIQNKYKNLLTNNRHSTEQDAQSKQDSHTNPPSNALMTEFNKFQQNAIYLQFLDCLTSTLCDNFLARPVRAKQTTDCLALLDNKSSSPIVMGFGDLVEGLPAWLLKANEIILSSQSTPHDL